MLGWYAVGVVCGVVIVREIGGYAAIAGIRQVFGHFVGVVWGGRRSPGMRSCRESCGEFEGFVCGLSGVTWPGS
jgi:hypothetical protein